MYNTGPGRIMRNRFENFFAARMRESADQAMELTSREVVDLEVDKVPPTFDGIVWARGRPLEPWLIVVATERRAEPRPRRNLHGLQDLAAPQRQCRRCRLARHALA
jgi:hypothetical protein